MSNIQVREAVRIKETWKGRPCKHPRFAKEYDLGAQTGDQVCLQCGETFSPEEFDRLMKRVKEEK